MSGKRRKRDKSRGTIKGWVGKLQRMRRELKKTEKGIAGLYREWWVGKLCRMR